MPSSMSTKRYVVGNPRNLSNGAWIIRDADKRYYAGDAYEGPDAAMWVSRGFLVEVTDGKE